jgi:hypothetical protein
MFTMFFNNLQIWFILAQSSDNIKFLFNSSEHWRMSAAHFLEGNFRQNQSAPSSGRKDIFTFIYFHEEATHIEFIMLTLNFRYWNLILIGYWIFCLNLCYFLKKLSFIKNCKIVNNYYFWKTFSFIKILWNCIITTKSHVLTTTKYSWQRIENRLIFSTEHILTLAFHLGQFSCCHKKAESHRGSMLRFKIKMFSLKELATLAQNTFYDKKWSEHWFSRKNASV